jgi:aminoglycoside phosphotransferase family enzyme/predicted kinase
MDQTGTIAFLEAELGQRSHARIDTHISTVLMAGDRVFKLKRAVRLPYADFSTADLRLAACHDEWRLNARAASALYVGVRRITATPDGLEFDGPGPLVDAVIEMRRFHQRDLFCSMADDGRLTIEIARLTAGRIAKFHQSLPPAAGVGGADSLAYAMTINRRMLAGCELFAPAKVTDLLARLDRRFAHVAPLLDARAEAGFVRRGHGDLHLANICLFDGAPTLFDCLDFSERLATTDVLYDLAFFLMDLWKHGLRRQANVAFNRYLDQTGDIEHLGLLPFFMAVRAVVRAHVLAAQLAQAKAPDPMKERDAHAYFALAQALLEETAPRLLAIGGLSGTGKSTLAANIADRIGAPPGARILSTDRIRKSLFEVTASTRLPPDAYRPEVSQRVYGEQRRLAAQVLGGGHSAIADGVFLKADERTAILQTATGAGARFDGLWLRAPSAVLVERVERRIGDASDATAAVVAMQAQAAPAETEWPTLNARQEQPEILRQALRALGD